ncbi:MAG: tetratricopeptide repeat protein [Bdellovibrionota bacterium]
MRLQLISKLKKNGFLKLGLTSLLASVFAFSAAEAKRKTLPKKKSSVSRASEANPKLAALRQQLSQALTMAKSGQYQQAATALFNLARRSELESEKAQIKYILGLMLMELHLNQVAAFQFVEVIRLENPKYTKLAIEKLSTVADGLGDDTLLNYAISRIDVNNIPTSGRDMIHFRIGEIKLKNKKLEEAIQNFSKVQLGSSYYNQALFNRGLAELELNRIDNSIKSFQQLLNLRSKIGITDTNRVAAQIAIARALYQKQDWDAAIEAYSQIPRDHFLWHQALFEQTWAMLRSARFRSSLSNLQSLHSTYYEDFYIPESLLLRSIVYLYICKYDEMEKVLTLFEKSYSPVKTKINSFLNNNTDPISFYNEIEKAQTIKKGEELKTPARLPYMVLKNISDEGDVRRSLGYMRRLTEEKQMIEGQSGLKSSSIGQYALKVIGTRLKNTKLTIGDIVKAHLQNMQSELKDLFEQASFTRYEMINGKKESLKKRIVGKNLPTPIDEKIDRDFYVENGFEYYPFQGEYWLDEIGNYHYLGQQNCE